MTDDPQPPHWELACEDVETLLAATTEELRAANTRNDDLAAENTRLAETNTRLLAMLEAAQNKKADLAQSIGDHVYQVEALNDELAHAEKAALPADTFTYATLGRDNVMATYRAVSGVRFGPLPRRIVADLETRAEAIATAMHKAGIAALIDQIRDCADPTE